MKTILGIFCVLFFLASNAQQTRITVKDNQFVQPSGDVVVFRGYNTSDPAKLSAQNKWNEAYFDEIKAWGGNIVRFPVHPSKWRALGKKKYLKLLDQGIQWASQRDIYVIIDWHSIGNLLTEQFYKDSYYTTKEETALFWEIIAQKYGKNATVAFYEIFNEPTTMKGELGQATWTDWKALNESMIQVIQKNGGEGISLVAGHNWAYDLSKAYQDPIQLENVAYVSHPYPQKRPKPWETPWTEDWGKMKEKAPVILTEIGFAGEEEKGAHIPVISDENYGRAISDYCEKHQISFVVWVFDAEWAPALFSNWDFKPTRHGAFFKKELTQ